MSSKDPAHRVAPSTVTIPPSSGPGSGKEAWRALALRVIEINDGVAQVIDEQRETIGILNAEVDRLRQQITSRKPTGGRLAVNDDTVAKIEIAVLAGGSTRQIAQRFKVSAMTVSRVRKRMDGRDPVPA